MLSHSIPFAPGRDAELFAALPASPAVFLVQTHEGAPYVNRTANLRRRVERLLGPVDPAAPKRLNLRERAVALEYTPTGSDFESRLLHYRVLRELDPRGYVKTLRLSPPALVRLNLDNAYPRAYVTRRIASLRARSRYYGPFSSRAAADKFLNAALDLFKTRRCTFELAPDPAFPGCVYSEMKMCLAPCFRGCMDEEYTAEIARLQAFLDSGGQSLKGELEALREKQSEQMDFEAAALTHTRLEKALAARALLPEHVRALDALSGVIVQPAQEKNCVALFRLDSGMISAPSLFTVEAQAVEAASGAEQKRRPGSMEWRIQEALAETAPAEAHSAAELMEHLALLRRWLYRSKPVGEIFLNDARGQLPLRRVVRGLSRVVKGERPEADAAESAAKQYWLSRTREELG